MTSIEPTLASQAEPALPDDAIAASIPEAATDGVAVAAAPVAAAPVDASAVDAAVIDPEASNAAASHAAAPVTAAPDAAGAAPDANADAGPRLRKLFPALFGHQAKPLKLQIQVDIQTRAPGAFSKKALSAFFRRYTGSHAYLNAVAHAKSRFDLDGQPAGELSAEHRDAAVQELARRRANQNARLELEEQQRRNRATLLHDFQTTTLTPANFCALKGVAVDELDGLLAIAKGEAEERSRLARLPNPAHDRSTRGPRDADRDRAPQGRRSPGRPPADARRR